MNATGYFKVIRIYVEKGAHGDKRCAGKTRREDVFPFNKYTEDDAHVAAVRSMGPYDRLARWGGTAISVATIGATP